MLVNSSFRPSASCSALFSTFDSRGAMVSCAASPCTFGLPASPARRAAASSAGSTPMPVQKGRNHPVLLLHEGEQEVIRVEARAVERVGQGVRSLDGFLGLDGELVVSHGEQKDTDGWAGGQIVTIFPRREVSMKSRASRDRLSPFLPAAVFAFGQAAVNYEDPAELEKLIEGKGTSPPTSSSMSARPRSTRRATSPRRSTSRDRDRVAAADRRPVGARSIVYCRSGSRSAAAPQALQDLGYTNVVDFGGRVRWMKPLVTGDKP